MDANKRKRLEKAGWKVGSASDFLDLSSAEAAYVEVKTKLSQRFAKRRKQLRMSQVAVAKAIRSSQSRVAKMEAGDPSVSIDLLVRSLLVLGSAPATLYRDLDG